MNNAIRSGRLEGGPAELYQQLPFELVKRGSTAPQKKERAARNR
jgi:hypothetical protein